MATRSSFVDGSGRRIDFIVDVTPDSEGGPYRTQIEFSNDDKDLQCEMYGQLIAQPRDLIGQRNLIKAYADAIVADIANNPNAPPNMKGLLPGYSQYVLEDATRLATKGVTVGSTRQLCTWGEASNRWDSDAINGTSGPAGIARWGDERDIVLDATARSLQRWYQ